MLLTSYMLSAFACLAACPCATAINAVLLLTSASLSFPCLSNLRPLLLQVTGSLRVFDC